MENGVYNVTWYVVNVEIAISTGEHQSGLPGEGGDGYNVGETHRGHGDRGPGPGLVESVRHLGKITVSTADRERQTGLTCAGR